MSSTNKETIYIDLEDDITSIIEKVRRSKEKIVALVLPKRAVMLQSVVNLKLLKRTADDAKKRVVLITSEEGLLSLAGVVGMHVARTLQTKPFIPDPPEQPLNSGALAATDNGANTLDPSKPVGDLAGLPEEDSPIEVDNSELAVSGVAASTAKAAKVKKERKLKIPNFGKFRTRLLLGGLLLLALIAGWVFAFMVLPKATITVETDAASITSNLQLVATTGASELDEETLTVPSEIEELKKTDTEKVPATGEKNIGTKASGSVTLSNCSDDKITIPAGTGVSSSNLTFITQSTVTLDEGEFSSPGSGGQCKSSGDHVKKVSVTAQNAGDKYNLAAGSDYTVATSTAVTGEGSAMTGGTSQVVKVISAADVDSAKEKLNARATSTADEELRAALDARGLFGIEDTLTAGQPAITTSPNVGDEASDVTVTAVTVYTMLGVKEDDLKKLLENDIRNQIDTERQTILENGLDDAAIRVVDRPSPTNIKLSLQAVSLAGPEVDVEKLKNEVVGKRRGEVIKLIQAHPGVKDVVVEYSPFWITTTPKKASKIDVIFKDPPKPSSETDASNE